MKPLVSSPLARAVCLGLVLALAWSARAGATWQSWSSADGLVPGTVRALLVDSDESLWIGAADGLGHFDGVSFSSFVAQPGLPDRTVNALARDAAGAIWVGTNAGPQRFVAGRPAPLAWPAPLAAAPINAIEMGGSGTLWLATNGFGVFGWDGRAWQQHTYDLSAGNLVSDRVTGLLEDPEGALWCATALGVSRLSTDGTWQAFTGGGLPSNEVKLLRRAPDSDAIYVVVSAGAARFRNGAWQPISFDSTIRDLLPLAGNAVWLATGSGLLHGDGVTWSTLTTVDGLLSNACERLFLDRDGHLWVSHSAGGLSRFDGFLWSTYDAGEGLPDTPVLAIAQDRSGNRWFGTAGLITRFDGAAVTTLLGGALPDPRIRSALFADGRLRVGTALGLLRYDGRASDRPAALAGSAINAIARAADGRVTLGTPTGPRYEDGLLVDPAAASLDARTLLWDADTLWVGTPRGLLRIDGAGLAAVVLPGTSLPAVSALGRDGQGRLCAGTGVGLFRRRASGWMREEAVQWRSSPAVVRTLTTDARGALWVGTTQALFVETDSGWATLPLVALALLADRAGNIWAGTSAGVTRFAAGSSRNAAFLNDPRARLTLERADGLVGGDVDALAEDSAGRLWLGTARDGLTRLEPDSTAPRVVFTTRPVNVSSAAEQTAVWRAAFGELSGLRYRVMLDDHEVREDEATLWSERLGAGGHRLHVEARDAWGNREVAPRELAFEIDLEAPVPLIRQPTAAAVLRGDAPISGTAADPRFSHYRLDTRPGASGAWTTLAASDDPVVDGPLGLWPTRAVPDGPHDLRLTVTDTLGVSGATIVGVIVDNVAPEAAVTSPVLVRAVTGGDVFTTNGGAHLALAPGALAGDAVVTLNPVADTDPRLSGFGSGDTLRAAFELDWPGTTLRHAAHLDMERGKGHADAPVGIFWRGPSGWRYLGGTPLAEDPTRQAVLITDPGLFVLADTSVRLDERGGLNLRVSPRALSRGVGGLRGRIDVGFHLSRAAEVTVRVIDRAGHRQRTLVDGRTFGTGENVLSWDGRDDDGQALARDLYFIVVETSEGHHAVPVAVVD